MEREPYVTFQKAPALWLMPLVSSIYASSKRAALRDQIICLPGFTAFTYGTRSVFYRVTCGNNIFLLKKCNSTKKFIAAFYTICVKKVEVNHLCIE